MHGRVADQMTAMMKTDDEESGRLLGRAGTRYYNVSSHLETNFDFNRPNGTD